MIGLDLSGLAAQSAAVPQDGGKGKASGQGKEEEKNDGKKKGVKDSKGKRAPSA
jgi:hypothetical protein